MIKILMEDNEEAKTSKLLKIACPNVFEFSDGDRNLISKIEELVTNTELLIVYIDLVPDNPNTMSEYNKVIKYIDNREYKNVILIPIFCIEHLVIQAFGDSRAEIVKCVLEDKLYKRFNGEKGIGQPKSFEKFCKKVANSKIGLCKSLKNDSNMLRGRFYVQDCKYGDIKLVNKAWDLVVQLPIFVDNTTNILYKGLNADIEKVKKASIDKYNKLCLAYRDTYGIPVTLLDDTGHIIV